MFSRKQQQGIGLAVLVFGAILLVLSFWLGHLTKVQVWILHFSAAGAMAVLGWILSGELKVEKAENAKWVRGGISATGGFAILILFPWLFPPPDTQTNVYLSIVSANGEALSGEFSVTYKRPGLNANTVSGTGNEVTLTDIPAGTSKVEITAFNHPGFVAIGEFPITLDVGDDQNATLKVRSRYGGNLEPTIDDVKASLSAAGVVKDQVLVQTLVTDEEKKRVELTVVNETGKNFEIYFYDCAYCFVDDREFKAKGKAHWMDIRVRETQPTKTYSVFHRFYTTSGLFDVYIQFNHAGQTEQQHLGVYNLFSPLSQEFVVSGEALNTGYRFHIEPSPLKQESETND